MKYNAVIYGELWSLCDGFLERSYEAGSDAEAILNAYEKSPDFVKVEDVHINRCEFANVDGVEMFGWRNIKDWDDPENARVYEGFE